MIGIVDLIDCRPMTKADEDAAWCDLQPGAYAWVTKPISFCRPVPILGKLHLFVVPDDKVVRIANDDTDWIHNYPPPQGQIKFTKRSPLLQ